MNKHVGLLITLAVVAVTGCSRTPDIDRDGGTVLVYEVDLSDRPRPLSEQDMQVMAQRIARRLETSGLVPGAEARPIGEDRVEISLPGISSEDARKLEQVKQAVIGMGYFELLILAERNVDQYLEPLIEQAGPESNTIKEDGEIVARWVRISRDAEGELRVDASPTAFQRETPAGDVELLAIIDPKLQFHGGHMATARASVDPAGYPCVSFKTTKEGATQLRAITALNLPDESTQTYRYLGIVMDNELLAAPRIMGTISDRGEITGRFTIEEIKLMAGMLQAGRFPAPLKPEPISDTVVPPK